jgi:hypothetical protein
VTVEDFVQVDLAAASAARDLVLRALAKLRADAELRSEVAS